MLNNICNYQKRNDLIITIIKDILKEHKQRQILILSDRKSQLNMYIKLLVKIIFVVLDIILVE